VRGAAPPRTTTSNRCRANCHATRACLWLSLKTFNYHIINSKLWYYI
jgi:hypothetical protein